MTLVFQRRGRDPEPEVSAAEVERAVIEDWAVGGRAGFLGQCLSSTPRDTGQKMVNKDDKLSVRRQCTLLTVARSNPVSSAHGRKRG